MEEKDRLEKETALLKAEKSFLVYWWVAFILCCPPIIFLFNRPVMVFGGTIPMLMAYVYVIYITSLFAIFFLGRNLTKHLRDD